MTEKKFNSKMPSSQNSVANNANNAALQAAAKAEREEKLRGALKLFILKERQRKKEEFEAKCEEERQRKEREARERENDMTLEETRTQISKLSEKLTELHNQKKQLFLQLKKVLNEDETRKKEQKDRAQVNAPPPQVFIPPVRVVHHQMPMLPKQPVGNQPVKRGRSPSPPPSHQGYYKSTNYTQPKHDDGRRGADYARVLWNKPPTQYQNSGTLFYQTTSTAPPPQPPTNDARALIFPPYNLPIRQAYHIDLQQSVQVTTSKTDQANPKPTQVYHINLDPPISQAPGVVTTGPPSSAVPSQKPQVTMEKLNDRFLVEVKHDPTAPTHVATAAHSLPENVFPLIQGMALHPNVLQISTNAVRNSKSGPNIPQGYTTSRTPASAHDQMGRQTQMTVIPGQPGGQPGQQPIHYPPSRFM